MKARIEKRHGVEVLVPELVEEGSIKQADRDELMTSKVSDSTKAMFRQMAKTLVSQGVEWLILGPSDLGFVIREEDVGVPIFDTAKIHALGIAKWALDETPG